MTQRKHQIKLILYSEAGCFVQNWKYYLEQQSFNCLILKPRLLSPWTDTQILSSSHTCFQHQSFQKQNLPWFFFHQVFSLFYWTKRAIYTILWDKEVVENRRGKERSVTTICLMPFKLFLVLFFEKDVVTYCYLLLFLTRSFIYW